MVVYRCPNCGESKTLWRGLDISGWVGIDAEGNRTSQREADWVDVEERTDGGCGECGWEGDVTAMRVVLGIDGEPLGEVHPGQISLEATA